MPHNTASSVTLSERVKGCLLGGTLGDTWGGPYEGISGPVRFEIPARPSLSDDTQLTLATCESLIEQGNVDPANIASHLLRWYRAGRIRGLGSSTLKALRDLEAGVHWAIAGARGEFAAGNGAAMRIAPLAFVLDPNNLQDRVIIRDVCRITHDNDEAYAGALAVVTAIRSVLSGDWSPTRSFLAATVGHLPDSAVRDRIAALLPLQLSACEIALRFGASGYVVDSVPFALYCAQLIAVEALEQVFARTISAGGDTDTNASMVGQLAGTVIGVSGVPVELVTAIDGNEEVSAIAAQFAAAVCNWQSASRSVDESTCP